MFSEFKIQLPVRTLGMAGALLVLFLAFALLTDGTFLTPRNLTLLARQMAVTAILGAGMVLVIVTGQIDLSVGAQTGFLGAVSALLFVEHGWPLPAALAAAVALGALAGTLQGTLTAKAGVPPFIVTLGGMLMFQGALLGVTGGVSVSPGPSYLFVGQGFLGRGASWALAAAAAALFLWRAARASGASRLQEAALAAAVLGLTAVLAAYEGVPVPVLLMLALTALLAGLARHTPFGRHLYAVGGNREAAFYAGIPVERRIVQVFTLMGALAGVAGVVLTARVGAATSDAGRMMELDAIAAAVIGGTSLLGGRGTVWGAVLGALIMATLDNGMSLMNTEAFWQPVLKGAILVSAVGLDLYGQKAK